MGQGKGYVDPEYLRLTAEQLAQLKRRTYAAMHIQPGSRILDVGCGPATDTVPMASLVGGMGHVVGIDSDPAMIQVADQLAAQAGVSDSVTHKVADVTMLPFEDDEFSACRSERLFQHLLDPVRALSELARVTSPGGWVVTLDTDWASMSVDSKYPDVERRIARTLVERYLNNGYGARQLYRQYKQQGFQHVSVEVYPVSITSYLMARFLAVMDKTEELALASKQITPEELDLWHEDLQQADEAGAFFATTSMILVCGQK